MTPDEKEIFDAKSILDADGHWKHILVDAGKLMTEGEEELVKRNAWDANDNFAEGMRWVLADVANAMRYDEVDAVPVVRCKDCIFSDKKEYKGAGDNIVMFCPNIGAYVGGNWFCADGERKE